MDTFTVRDLRERTGALIHDAEAGGLSLITKHGRPVFLAVPFDQDMLKVGLPTSLAIKLYQDNVLTIARAAKLAGQSIESFIEKLGVLGIPAVTYSPNEINEELENFG